MGSNNDFKELVKSIRQNKPFESNYYILSNNSLKSFKTPFKYVDGKPICVGDIVEISCEMDKSREYSQRINHGTFIVKFDETCETRDGYYLWDGECSKRFDERENIEKISNVYAHLMSKAERLDIHFTRYSDNIDEKFTKDISKDRLDPIFYDKNKTISWTYNNSDDFELRHNEVDEFIQFCKYYSVESLIDSSKAKEIKIHLPMNLGLGGQKNETITLSDLIKFCIKDEITNDRDLYRMIIDNIDNNAEIEYNATKKVKRR